MGKAKEASSPPQNTMSVESRRDALLDAEAKESPVLSTIAKRLRAAKKKVKKAEEIEAKRENGKTINADQEEALNAKAKNVATIEELERLFPLLKEAIGQEVAEKIAQKETEIELKAKEAAAITFAEQAKALAEENEIERSKATSLAEELKLRAESALADKQLFEEQNAKAQSDHQNAIAELEGTSKASTQVIVSRILKLFYFSRLFSKEGFANDYVPTTERNACLSYDQSLEPTDERLTERDLEEICAFGKHMSSRPPSDIISHEKALERCISLANDWVNGEDLTLPFLHSSVADLVVKFERIQNSGYYTVQPCEVAPEVKPPQNQHPSFQPDPVQSARSGALNGHYPGPNTFGSNGSLSGPPNQMQNGNILQHMLGPRPGQVPHDRQLPAEALAFMPPLSNSSIPQQASGALDPSLHGPLVPHPPGPSFSSGTNQQPPGFEVGGQNKSAPGEGNAPIQFNDNSFQGTRFGGNHIPAPATHKPEAVDQNLHQTSTHHQPSYTPLHDNIPPAPSTSNQSNQLNIRAADSVPAPQVAEPQASAQPTGSVEVKFSSESASADPRNVPSNPAGNRPSRGVSDQFRGRGAPRGRGGGRGRDFVPRGGQGGRGGYNPGRGQRGGRGSRDFVPQQAPYSAAAY